MLTSVNQCLWGRVRKTSGCWCWAGQTSPKGYGRLTVGGQEWRAHRLAWTLAFGPIPAGLCVLHSCDNPPCVRPSHLWLGTQADNMADRDRKGRQRTPTNAANRGTKLSEKTVTTIRQRYAAGGIRQRELAAEYEVAQQHVSGIVRGQYRRHVNSPS